MIAAISILVVEDVQVISDFIRDALSARGYSVCVAISGHEAKSLLERSGTIFSGVITDIGIGVGPDGWEVARLARAQNPHVFVIYLTGSATNAKEAVIVEGGLVVRKPVTAAALMQAVAKLQNKDLGAPKEPRSPEVEALYVRLGLAEDDNRQLTQKAETLAMERSVSTRGDLIALAESREETKLGQADLLASETALAHSQAETKHGLAELLASESALASSQEETKVGLIDLLASASALATSRAETKISLADLLASATALAASRAENQTGQTDLLASEVANRALSLANDLLVTNEAALERLVEQRTADLTREMEERRIAEDALRQGEKLQAIGQLTGGIAHDFNNILQIVFSTAAFLRSSNVTDVRRNELLDSLEDAAALGGQATSRLLAFARKKVLSPRSCNINSLVEGMAELLSPTLGPKVTFETDLASNLSEVIADHGELEVAILNLASNARDAMLPEGGVFKLTSSAAYHERTSDRPAGEYVCLTVSDTGPGMPSDVASHAFEPFFTTKPRGKGTGLGLAQVWGFAKQSGGDVAIETSSEGTLLTLYFPRPSVEALEASLATEAHEASLARREPELRRKTVLVVEDNRDLAKLTTSLLQQIGYDTLSAENARQALDCFAGDTKIDAVFSDVVMPGDMNGVELAKTLYRLYPRLPVTLATGYSEYLVEHPGPRSVEVLSKPYRIGELTAAIGRSFARVKLAA
jgi:signal transduction histidine kinase/DNA-binding response OmpR family regulator